MPKRACLLFLKQMLALVHAQFVSYSLVHLAEIWYTK